MEVEVEWWRERWREPRACIHFWKEQEGWRNREVNDGHGTREGEKKKKKKSEGGKKEGGWRDKKARLKKKCMGMDGLQCFSEVLRFLSCLVFVFV